MRDYYFINIVGNLLETALAVHHLIFASTLERCTDLKILTVHGGGSLPSYAGRIDHAWCALKDCHAGLPNPPSHYLRKNYFDSVVFSIHQLEYLVKTNGGDKIVMGTDYLIDMADYDPVEYIASATALSDEEITKVAGLTTAKFLGALKQMSICIIGLGIMGSAYAGTLVKAGETVIGVDPSEAARKSASEYGVEVHAEPGEWISSCDLIILSLVSPIVLELVSTNICGLLNPGQIVLETGTFALSDKLKAQKIFAEAGVILLDCPVSGTGIQAVKGDLVMMASGPNEAVERARTIMEQFTKLVINAGEFGFGIKLKFVANHAVAVHNVAAAETLNYSDNLGLDRDIVYKMLSDGAGQSRMSDLRMPLMISGEYEPPTASMKMFEKDLSIIGDDIVEKDVQAPLFFAARELYDSAFETLPETLDTAAVFKIYSQDKSN